MVDASWPEKSGLTDKTAKTGLEQRWSAPDKVESRKIDGWEEMYAIGNEKKTTSRLVPKNGSVPIGRRKEIT